MNVLIVEDDRNIAYLAQYHVQRLGHENVTVLGSGTEAIERLATEHFDLILLDWMLPDVSGIDVVRSARSNESHRHTPIIMITARNRPEDVLAAVDAGANDYIVKPFDRSVLQEKVVNLLGREPGSASRST